MRWGENTTLKFVKLYLKNECLWNPEHPLYKSRTTRNKAYNDIINEFKEISNKTLGMLELKHKIKNLRTTYSQEVHKILTKSTPDNIYSPSLIWFEEMDHCLKYVSSVYRQAQPLNTTQESQLNSSAEIWVDPDVAEGSSELNPDPLIPEEDIEYNRDQEDHLIKREYQTSPETYVKVKKKKTKHRNHRQFSSDSNSDTPLKDTSKEDEFDIYGKYIASQLRSMHLRKALRLQLKFQSLINDARMSEHND